MPLSPRYVHTTHMGVMSPSWVLAFAFGHEQESLGCVSLHSFYQERERRSPVLSSNLIISCPSSHSITTQTNVESYLFHLYNSFVYTASPSCQPFLVSPRRTTSTWHCFLDSHHKRNQLMIVMLESVNPVSADSMFYFTSFCSMTMRAWYMQYIALYKEVSAFDTNQSACDYCYGEVEWQAQNK